MRAPLALSFSRLPRRGPAITTLPLALHDPCEGEKPGLLTARAARW
jgi:hypothetical protein